MKQFLKDTAERAIKTAAQTAIATIGTTALVHEVDWVIVASTVGLATLLSVLTSLGSVKFGENGTASLVNTEGEN